MEARKITVVDTASNKKVVINTDATTFGELKRAVVAAGVDIAGKDWLEGVTQSIPVGDDSQLPTNVTYRGQVTNNLLYMLTNTEKKIKNGLTRAQVYQKIVSKKLQEAVKDKFGKNYTQCKTYVLEEFLDSYNSKAVGEKKTPEEPCNCNVEPKCDKYNKLVQCVAVFLANIPTDVANDVQEALAGIKTPTEVDFSDFPVDDVIDMLK